jgi:hypothetical protein
MRLSIRSASATLGVTLLFAGGLALSLLATDRATAVDAAKPVPCGAVVSDPSGDGNYKALFGPAGQGPNLADMDILRGWIQFNAAGEATVNIEVNDLTSARGQEWDAFFTVGSTEVNAYGFTYVDTGRADFEVTVGDADAVTVPGKLFPGAKGVVQIVLPESVEITPGGQIKDLRFTTYFRIADDYAPDYNAQADPTGDAPTVKTYTVAQCGGSGGGSTQESTGATSTSGASTTDTSGGSTTAGTTTAPGATQQGTTTSGTTTSGRPSQQPTRGPNSVFVKLKLNFSRFGGSAKKLTKARVLRLKVRSTGGRIRNLRAYLYFGAKPKGSVYAFGKLASINGKGTLQLRVARKLKPGSYYLQVIGVAPNGKTGLASARLRFS